MLLIFLSMNIKITRNLWGRQKMQCL